MCENLSLSHICKPCQNNLLQPSLYKRELLGGIAVFSFYKYSEIKELLHTKHTDVGYYIYTILAKLAFKTFAEHFHTQEHYSAIAIDYTAKSGYSHTAILNKHLGSYNIKPLFNILRAQNDVSYSGKSKSFREQNKRDFRCSTIEAKKIILVDDIITTGTTMQEAIRTIGRSKVAFCLCLADARKF